MSAAIPINWHDEWLKSEARVRELEQERERLKDEIKSGDEMYEAQQQKYADCPHKPISGEVGECGCSFDRLGDVCAYHAPALRALQIQLQAVTQQLAMAERALELCVHRAEMAEAQLAAVTQERADLREALGLKIDELATHAKWAAAEIRKEKEIWSNNCREVAQLQARNQELEALIEKIRRVSCGEEQVAEDDTAGLAWIFSEIRDAALARTEESSPEKESK